MLYIYTKHNRRSEPVLFKKKRCPLLSTGVVVNVHRVANEVIIISAGDSFTAGIGPYQMVCASSLPSRVSRIVFCSHAAGRLKRCTAFLHVLALVSVHLSELFSASQHTSATDSSWFTAINQRPTCHIIKVHETSRKGL